MTSQPASAPDHTVTPPGDPEDPREQINYGVMMASGRLAPRHFASRDEAERWAQEDEQVVAWNFVCDCDM